MAVIVGDFVQEAYGKASVRNPKTSNTNLPGIIKTSQKIERLSKHAPALLERQRVSSGSQMHFLGTIIPALPVCACVFLYLLMCVAIVFIQLRT